jgi:uncharacterized surface protein with fasciclin (FAS1) repeats
MKEMHRKQLAAAGLTAVAILGVSACSSDTASDTASSGSSSASSTSSSAMSSSSAAPSSSAMADPAADLVGTGCAGYGEANPTGPGSIVGMSTEPVATAASGNPELSTLVTALSGKLNPNVNLVETLNSNPALTVFAPTNAAFAKIDAATMEKLKTDSDLLSSILTYHVVEGQATPAKVVGDHKTLQGGNVTVTGEGETIKVNDAGLVCGGVKTANATVYMIDTVLMPPAAG